MLSEYIENRINLAALKEEAKKVDVNFITAGIVGVFINPFVGTNFSAMFWTCLWISFIGFTCLFLGVVKSN